MCTDIQTVFTIYSGSLAVSTLSRPIFQPHCCEAEISYPGCQQAPDEGSALLYAEVPSAVTAQTGDTA